MTRPDATRPGFWPSPLTPAAMAAQPGRVSDLQILGNSTYWLESRPQQGGRNALMCQRGETLSEVLPPEVSVRTRAHEYGGAPYIATARGVFYVNDADQRLYLAAPTGEISALTPPAQARFADLFWDNKRELLWAVREDFSSEPPEADSAPTDPDTAHAPIQSHTAQPRSAIISVHVPTLTLSVRVSGADFYAAPSVSPNGEELTYMSWDHPDMPWQASSVWLASLGAGGELRAVKHVAGGRHDGENSRPVAVFGPKFSPRGELFFCDDRSNWWNIYRYNGRDIECVYAAAAEFATPQWVFGMSCFDFLTTKTLIACYNQEGQWRLGVIDITRGHLEPVTSPFTDIQQIRAHQGSAAFIAGSPSRLNAVYQWRQGQLRALSPVTPSLASADISQPETLSFPTRDGEWAHGFFYPPQNAAHKLDGALPPLLVMAHGGPTGAAETSFSSKIQFWTTRGFAVLDVNYRGSTGFGRRYRDRLLGNWGVTDVMDVCSGAAFLASQKRVDPAAMIIRGSSAGGFTVLAALTFGDTFTMGASLYGIGDLEALVRDTHKFEAHYLDGLIAPFPDPLYRERSPLYHTQKLACPVIFLQGLEDKVVPPAQAEAMVKALTDKGIRTEYVTFSDEGHGFRRAANIARAFSAELAFYQTELAQSHPLNI